LLSVLTVFCRLLKGWLWSMLWCGCCLRLGASVVGLAWDALGIVGFRWLPRQVQCLGMERSSLFWWIFWGHLVLIVSLFLTYLATCSPTTAAALFNWDIKSLNWAWRTKPCLHKAQSGTTWCNNCSNLTAEQWQSKGTWIVPFHAVHGMPEDTDMWSRQSFNTVIAILHTEASFTLAQERIRSKVFAWTSLLNYIHC